MLTSSLPLVGPEPDIATNRYSITWSARVSSVGNMLRANPSVAETRVDYTKRPHDERLTTFAARQAVQRANVIVNRLLMSIAEGKRGTGC